MKLYVGTYAKYNSGSIEGKWMDLDDYADAEEFEEACLKLHEDEEDPELMFQDVECDHDWEEKLYDESGIPSEYWDVRDALDRSGIDDAVFDAWVGVTDGRIDEDAVKKCEEQYLGRMSGRDFAERFCDERGYLPEDTPSIILSNIDWGGVWSDLEDDGCVEKNGYIFDTYR